MAAAVRASMVRKCHSYVTAVYKQKRLQHVHAQHICKFTAGAADLKPMQQGQAR